MRALGASVLLAACVVAGCGHARQEPRHRVGMLALPDMSGAATSVQTQAHDRAARVQQLVNLPAPAPDQLAEAFGDLGKLLLAAEFTVQAGDCFRNAETLVPADSRWPYFLGHVYRKQANANEAAAAFTRAISRQPENVPALYWLGESYLDLGRADDAGRVFEQALSIAPTSTAVQSGLGHVALAHADYAGAVSRFEQILAADPTAAYVRYSLAMAYRGVGQLDRARDNLREPRQIEPGPVDPLMSDVARLLDSPMAFQARGIEALKHGQAEAATQAFRDAVRLDPESGPLHHRLGTALFLGGDVAGATREFQEALRLSPNLARAHYSLGVALASSGRDGDAVAEFGAAVNADPDYLEAHLALGEVLRGLGRGGEAVREYDRALHLAPANADAAFGRAMSLALLGRRDEAQTEFREGAQRYPDRREFTDALHHLDQSTTYE